MLISVIIPAYNSASRIKFSLESVIAQNFSQLEIILVDDASQDNTPIIAREILKSSQRNFKIITHAKNFGVSAARNTGLENSNGEYICFLDADDLLHKNFLSRLHELITKYSADFSFCELGRIFPNGNHAQNNLSHKNFLEGFMKKNGTDKNSTHLQDFSGVPDGENNLLQKNFFSQKIISQNLSGIAKGEDFIFKKTISPVCCLYDKKFLNDNDLRFFAGCSSGEDVEFQIKVLCRAEKVAFTSECLYFYVQHDNMGSVRDNNTREKKIMRYEHNTGAQIRTALFLAEHAKSERVKIFNERILHPQNIIRKCNLYAMKKDRDGYNSLVNDESARKILKRCVLWKKPEIFFKAFMILHFPNIYYRLREK